MQVVRLIYTNSGLALLALISNAVHKLWKWQRSERNPLGKVLVLFFHLLLVPLLCSYIFDGFLLHNFQSTANVAPQLWQPANGTLMTNDIGDNNPPEDSAACIALSKNDSYVMSASGGKVSLFNMMTFKVFFPASLVFISFLTRSYLYSFGMHIIIIAFPYNSAIWLLLLRS